MNQKKGLGSGVNALFSQQGVKKTEVAASASLESSQKGAYRTVALHKITPNRQQPRFVFDEDKIRELSESIKEQGLLQPLVVSELADGRYELIAGERRLRASRLAELEEVPVVIKDVDAESMLALAILENVQREDLNPIEEAKSYQELLERYDYSQEDIAKKMGKSRTAIANTLRLLRLPQVMKEDLAQNRYNTGHARAILALGSIHEQLKMREQILKNTLSVRDVEQMVRERLGRSQRISAASKKKLSPQQAAVQDQMRKSLGLKVNLKPGKEGRGKLVIEYYNDKDLNRVYQKIVDSGLLS